MSNKVNYNSIIIDKIEKLLKENKKIYKTDLHIHTTYSADGLQTIEQSICKAKEKQIDIISITDHDSIGAYKEIIMNKLYDNLVTPIIIPGIEFTVSYPEYYGRCHVLKYFYDYDNTAFRSNLQQNYKAYRNRINIWFKRIAENRCLQYYFLQYNITCTKDGYKNFLMQCTPSIPEYPTLMQYIYSLLSKKGINVWDVYERTIAINNTDNCENRRQNKRKALAKFYDKYNCQDISYNYRKLRPILAPLGVDDADYPEFDSSGSLSVNEYGQVSIHKLINSGINILAHPDRNRLNCVNEIKGVIHGLELNYRSSISANEATYEKAKNLSLLITKGSDKHSNTDEFYDDLSFYDITHEELEKMILLVKKQLMAIKI